MNQTSQINRPQLETELRALATSVNEWWLAQMAADDRLRKSELFRRYPDLGTDKTFGRFLRGDFSDTATTLEDWVDEYRTTWAAIEELGVRQRAQGVRNVLHTLSGVKAARKAIIGLTEEASTRRVILVTGDSGCGKSCIVLSLQQRWGSRVVPVEVQSVWQDKPNRLLGAICAAVGMKSAGLPDSPADKMQLVISHLKSTRTCLVLEEGHHMGPQMLNAIKTLTNQTPGEFVVIAIPTLLRRLQMAAYEEARQVFNSHRLAQTIALKITASDALLLMTDRLGEFEGARQAAAWLVESTRAPRHGNLGFVRDVIDEVMETRARTGDDGQMTAQDITRAADAVISRR